MRMKLKTARKKPTFVKPCATFSTAVISQGASRRELRTTHAFEFVPQFVEMPCLFVSVKCAGTGKLK